MYLKKHGFTLAEVLVTLGIIGVVAALTTPALIQNVGNAKVGPKLQKAVSTFEVAAEMMLTDESVNGISTITLNGDVLGNRLSNYMKLIKKDATKTQLKIPYKTYNGKANYTINSGNEGTSYYRYDLNDDVTFWFGGGSTYQRNRQIDPEYADVANVPSNKYLGPVWIDINAAEGPNRQAKDIFKFALYEDGTLRPWGGNKFMRANIQVQYWNQKNSTVQANYICVGDPYAEGYYAGYEESCGTNCGKDKVTYPDTCAGSIFDNNLKMIYK